MIIIGLTGSIGMGKSTAAQILRRLRVPVHEADEEVHKLLSPKGAAFAAVAAAFPYSGYPQIYGRKNKAGIRLLNRKKLGEIVFHDDRARLKLEAIIHPLVRAAQNDFIRHARASGRKIVALDIPLLFETGGEKFVDRTICVTAPPDVQRARVMARPGMDENKFYAILARQMPDGEKCARADYVVHTGLGLAQTTKELKAVLRDIKEQKTQ